MIILYFKFGTTTDKLSKALYAGLLGGGGYFLYNIRSVYIFPLAIGAFFLLFKLKRYAIVSLVALMVVSIPQGVINMNTNGHYSIELNSTYGVGEENLNLFMFRYGINGVRYECFVGDASIGYPVAIDFLSPTGNQLLKIEKIETFKTTGEYVEFVLKYPIDVIIMYANHFVAGLDARFGEIYMQNPNSYRGMYTIANIAILFLALFGIFVEYLKSKESKKYIRKVNAIIFVVLILPVIAILPAVVETRYYFPLHFLIYLFIIFKLDYENMKIVFMSHKYLVILLIVLFAILMLVLWQGTLTNIMVGPPIYV